MKRGAKHILQFKYKDAYLYEKEMPEQNSILATEQGQHVKEKRINSKSNRLIASRTQLIGTSIDAGFWLPR
jgi:hypothetical protein